ncbi:kinase-like protein [Aspergillus steynii IBT 23096]|uniref:Kinase-like protein n=1 Tax=Aspergillus steynii IBT 23096 TaxID=1392250 RepID=A0A2I2FZ51_9EURO|nr:kinase-like protein [Aspergillus steynii IBT 23096]PLB45826.1 kinase-like protein [Aspergillus steynii IBT 23096]
MDPYVTEPEDIPSTDLYADIPLYGRYRPKQSDFHVNPEHIGSLSSDSIRYWESVLDSCDESVRIYPADEDGRDVFALGSVIVKSAHLHETRGIDYSFADANEAAAVSIAKGVLGDIRVPDIYFVGQIHDRPVIIQERLPGVTLEVAWPYLSHDQRQSFKDQARAILRQLHTIKPKDDLQARSHVVPDPNILRNGRLNPLEEDILFAETNTDPDMSFMHNDFTPSNCIVDNDNIVGLIDWEMAGFFGWKTAGEVHRRIRTPQREHLVNASLSEEELQCMMFWNDLYDD